MSTLTTRLAPSGALRLIVVTLMVSSLLLLAGGITPVVQADYADGTGQGLYQNQIYWLEWDGFTFADGQSRTFNLPGNVTVVATVSNISSGAGAHQPARGLRAGCHESAPTPTPAKRRSIAAMHAQIDFA